MSARSYFYQCILSKLTPFEDYFSETKESVRTEKKSHRAGEQLQITLTLGMLKQEVCIRLDVEILLQNCKMEVFIGAIMNITKSGEVMKNNWFLCRATFTNQMCSKLLLFYILYLFHVNNSNKY